MASSVTDAWSMLPLLEYPTGWPVASYTVDKIAGEAHSR